jgi:hypothetical protein
MVTYSRRNQNYESDKKAALEVASHCRCLCSAASIARWGKCLPAAHPLGNATSLRAR